MKSSESHDGEKKKSKGGFLNLIKRSSKSDKSDKADKSEKSEKNHMTPLSSSMSSASAGAAPAFTIPEEPSSPKLAVKSPPLESKSRYISYHSSLPCTSLPQPQ